MVTSELEPEFLVPSHLCFLGPNHGHLLEPERAALLGAAPDLTAHGGRPTGGLRACAQPVSAPGPLGPLL